MNAFILIVPLLLIRFLLLNIISPTAVRETAKFAPLIGIEKFFYYIYQLTTMILIILPIFLQIQFKSTLNYLGIGIYLMGLTVLLFSVVDFAKQSQRTLRVKGIYRYSRNPMYLGYLLFFLGCTVITQSVYLFCCLFLFQMSTHFIILSEERWCEKKFGMEYNEYKKKVRRYL